MALNNNYRDFIRTTIQGDISYCALVTNFDTPNASTDITDVDINELGRTSTITTTLVASNVLDIQATFNASIICADTTVSTGTSDTEVDVADPTGFNVGDKILVGGTAFTKILDITGTTFTVESIGTAPAVSATVQQYITQFHIVKGGSATANTGETMFEPIYLELYKASAKILTVNAFVKIKGVT